MSRVGKNPVPVPAGVSVAVEDGKFSAKGKLGHLSMALSRDVLVSVDGGQVTVRPNGDGKRARMMWGTTRNLVRNLVKGVSEGFTVNLEISGVGYRAAVEGSDLVLSLGYSHPVRYPIPEGVTVKCERPTAIAISGADRQKIGQVASEIRAWREPEPYKGKGIKYAGEVILRKEGKKK
ncbi:MAG: 50S ribosomal protein L6 [Thalassobaculales bacterium]